LNFVPTVIYVGKLQKLQPAKHDNNQYVEKTKVLINFSATEKECF